MPQLEVVPRVEGTPLTKLCNYGISVVGYRMLAKRQEVWQLGYSNVTNKHGVHKMPLIPEMKSRLYDDLSGVSTIPRIQENELHLYEHYILWGKGRSQGMTIICSTKETLLIRKRNQALSRLHTC